MKCQYSMPLMAWKSSSGCSEILQQGWEEARETEKGKGEERERSLSVVFLSTFWREGETELKPVCVSLRYTPIQFVLYSEL